MSVIFLDIDGVLNSDSYFDDRKEEISKFNHENFQTHNIFATNETGKLVEWGLLRIDPFEVELIKKLSEVTKSSIVLISSWSELSFYEDIIDRLKDLGLPIIGYVDGSTTYRDFGINEYINRNSHMDSYVIVDGGSGIEYSNIDKVVITDSDNGLTISDCEYIKAILDRKIRRIK